MGAGAVGQLHMTRARGTTAALAAAVLLLGQPSPAGAAPATVLDLQLNDAPGARTAVDASGLLHHGTIGSHPVLDGSVAHL